MLSYSLLLIGGTSAIGLALLYRGLVTSLKQAPRLENNNKCEKDLSNVSLTVILPTYNEEVRIRDCLESLLRSFDPCREWNVIMVDDCSTDNTVEIALSVIKEFQLPMDRFRIISAGPRPRKERWVGKNWPCAIAMQEIYSDWILFIDADVCVSQDALRRALLKGIDEKVDLLSLAPRICCSCLAEWMVQPIMGILLGVGFPISSINDPLNERAFAAGPFMLFRRISYNAIGGHREIAHEVVEDIALAHAIKSRGLRLRFFLATELLELNMYKDLSSLWEGWTKNWYIGLDRNILKAIGVSSLVFILFSLPWLLLPVSGLCIILSGIEREIFISSFLIFGICIYMQFCMRLWSYREFRIPIKYWWLMGLGGILIGALGPTSVWRTVTGRGWTWKGRHLA